MAIGLLGLVAPGANAAADTVVSTPAYTWHGDTVTQGPFKAYAPSGHEIVSDYSAQPGYYMGIDKVWKLKNDISAYPKLVTPGVCMRQSITWGLMRWSMQLNPTQHCAPARSGPAYGHAM